MNHQRPFALMVVFVFLLFASCLLPTAFSQSATATLSGTVEDQNGAVVPGVELTVLNVETYAKRQATTNEAGYFTVPLLPPGRYTVTARREGFTRVEIPNVILNVGDEKALRIQLKAGDINATVQVINEAELISESPAVSTVVDRNFAENIPLNGRSFQALIQLTPGTVVTTSNSYDSGQFSVNGQRASSNYWMVDGVSANIGIGASVNGPGNGLGGTLGSFSALGGTNSLVSVDAMEEFRIQTSTYAPEFGRTPGGQISIVTRSGTNQFHGSAFDYLRNDVFDANNWFANSKGLPKPKERQNDFGGTFNGPIFKGKTFFFFSYEGLRLRLPQTALTVVPDLAARQSSTPAVRPYLDAFPLPNGSDNIATGVAQFNASYSNPSTLDAYSLRVDQRLGSKLSVFGRYNQAPSEFVARGTSGGNSPLNDLQRTQIRTQTATTGVTWTLSPAVTNDLRFNYSRSNAQSNAFMDGFGGAVPLNSPPFPDALTFQSGLLLLNIFSLKQGQVYVGPQAHNTQRQINVVDSLFWQRGSHAFKFGVDFRRLSPEYSPPGYQQTALFFTVPAFKTGASFFGNVISRANGTLLLRNLGTFAQDTWRALPNLTLTYGLRWDVDFVPSSLNGPSIPAVTGYSLTDLSQFAFAPPGTPPFKTTYRNLAPRLGVAYEISQSQNWQTIFRGGFGVFYDLLSAETGNLISLGTAPFAGISFFLHPTFPFNANQIAAPPLPSTGNTTFAFALNPKLKLPYTLEWNLALEQSLGKEQTLSVSYVGAAGKRLLQTTVIFNPPTNPALQGFFTDNTATSNYNALQVQFQRRLSRGLQALASYTWSHSIDTASASSYYGNPSNALVPNNPNTNRGSSDFDIRSSFSAGITYRIPAPKLRTLANALLSGWSIDNIIFARSRPPVDISDINFFGFNTGIQTNIRPDVVAGQPLYLFGSQYPGGKAFNPAAFADPPADPITGNPLRQGTLGRNALRGFGAWQWDFAVHRDFRLYESLHLQFRAEMFNVLNHSNFGPPNNQFGSAGFGLSTETLGQSLSGGGGTGNLGSGAFNPLYQIGGPRSIQLAFKLFF